MAEDGYADHFIGAHVVGVAGGGRATNGQGQPEVPASADPQPVPRKASDPRADSKSVTGVLAGAVSMG